MKQIVLSIFGIIFSILMLQGNALCADPVKIAVIDMQMFQQKSRAFQTITMQLRSKFDDLGRKLNEEKQGIIKLEEELRKQSMMLSLDAKENKQQDLEKKTRYYKYLQAEYTQEMKDAEMESTKKVGKELEKVVEKIAKAKGYTIILDTRILGLIYYKGAVDITEEVIEAYDRVKK